MLAYFSQVSIFDSMFALIAILAINWAFTLIHILQEWKGEAVPLWRVFGAVVGLWIPNWAGFLVFTVTLCAVQWLIGTMGIAGSLPLVGLLPRWLAVWALGFTIGARLSDCVVSHWRLYSLGYRPNPGLSSTALYGIEAVFLLFVFHKGLLHHPVAAVFGLAAGAGLFIAVLPLMRWFRGKVPSWRREIWASGEPIPAWAKT